MEKAKKSCKEERGCPQITDKDTGVVLDVRESPLPPKYELPLTMPKKYHQSHLENFFAAVLSDGKIKLNCPADIGYETAVTVLKVNDAAQAGCKLDFKGEEFIA